MARRRRRSIALVLGALVAVYVVVANVVVLRTTTSDVVDAARVAPAPVIIVLGAGIHPDGTPTDVLADRLDAALELYRAGLAPRVLCSGDHGRESHDETGAMERYLEARGVPAEAIFLDHAGFDSFNTVARARRIFGVTRAILVTQAYHLPRVLWTAAREGIEAQGVAADRRDYPAIAWYQAREVLSRSKAVLDVAIGRSPRTLGATIDLGGDGRVTR